MGLSSENRNPVTILFSMPASVSTAALHLFGISLAETVRRMTGNALLRQQRELRNRLFDIHIDSRFLGQARELTGLAVHLGPDFLHFLRHVRGHVRRVVRNQRGHAQAIFRDIRRALESAGAERLLDFRKCRQVVAHVAQHVLLHHGRHGDELPCIVTTGNHDWRKGK